MSSQQKEIITFALSKGKLLAPTLAFLKRLNLVVPFSLADDRRLIFDLPEQKIRILLVRATDVPTYVEYGVADIGVVGSDLLMEQMRDLYELVDLRFGACSLVLAEPALKRRGEGSKPRIATKYPNMTERYFSEKGVSIEMIKLYGSIELAPLVGLADQIVDLSQTGETLKAHGLVKVDEIAKCSARLIVNRAALKLKYQNMMRWIDAIKREVR